MNLCFLLSNVLFSIMYCELLLKFIGYLPDYLLALSRTLLRFYWTTFVETAVYSLTFVHGTSTNLPLKVA